MERSMSYYQASAGPSDKAKAIALVMLVHMLLAALILTGLDVRIVRGTVDRLRTFDITEVPPPPPLPPPPQPHSGRTREAEGAAGKKAIPTPVVAPNPEIVVPAKPPVVAAPVAGTGSESRAGAAISGLGTGAGGSGTGLGGGGSGSGGGGSAARWLSGGLYDSDNRGGRWTGVVAVRFTVEPSGLVDRCRIVRSSGDGDLDTATCFLVERRLRFAPARDSFGRPVPSEVGSTYTWGVRRRQPD